MNRIALLAGGTLMALLLAACGQNAPKKAEPQQSQETMQQVTPAEPAAPAAEPAAPAAESAAPAAESAAPAAESAAPAAESAAPAAENK